MNEKFYLGTYTKRDSKGVYSVLLNKETEQLESLTLEATIENPTYLSYSKTDQLLFVVGKGGELCGISANNAKVSPLESLANYDDQQAVPCYIRYNEKTGDVLTANYHGGFVELYHYDKDAKAFTFVDKKVHTGSGA
jgi:6-phosphogluconolactonase